MRQIFKKNYSVYRVVCRIWATQGINELVAQRIPMKNFTTRINRK